MGDIKPSRQKVLMRPLFVSSHQHCTVLIVQRARRGFFVNDSVTKTIATFRTRLFAYRNVGTTQLTVSAKAVRSFVTILVFYTDNPMYVT